MNNNIDVNNKPVKPVPLVKLEDLQNFSATSISRNKSLALVFNLMRHMEETCVGMETYKEMRDKYKLPLPIIANVEPNHVVTFPRNADAVRSLGDTDVLEQLNDEELAGFDFVKTCGGVSRKEYEDHFGFGRKKASNQLKKLKRLGLIDDNGKPITSHDFRYVTLGLK